MTLEGRCTNFGGDCTLAKLKTPQPMTSGADAYCAECHSLLFPVRSGKEDRRRRLLITAAAGLVLLAIVAAVSWPRKNGDNAQSASPVPSASAVAIVTVPPLRLCGSSVMGDRLAKLLAQGFASHRSAGAPVPVASASGSPTSLFGSAAVPVSIESHGTSGGFGLLADGKCDVAMASRQIGPAERTRLRLFGDMSAPSAEHPIGLDGIVIVVNTANPVSALSIPEIRQVFGGTIRDWSAVHGKRGTINLYAPTVNNGTVDALKLLAMGNVPFAPRTRRVPTVTDVARAVAHDPQGVGFVPLPYASGVKRLSVTFQTQQLAPDQISVSRETYPLARRLYLYTAPRMSPLVSEFIDYVQSDEGQLNVDRAGFVGSTQPPHPPTPIPLRSGTPPKYADLVHATHQSEFVFFFRTDSDVLDNKALLDIERLVQVMREPSNRHQQIILAGFADNRGTHAHNVALSFARAHSVQRELRTRRVTVKEAIGFGEAIPIGDNGTPEGRQKNRRVEIFITFKPS